MKNRKVAVVLFEGKEIQIPSNDCTGDTVFIKSENEKYTVALKEDLNKEKATSKNFITYAKKKNNENLVMDNEGVGI